MNKVIETVKSVWDVMPRKLKYTLLGMGLAWVQWKFPGVLPNIDPEWYLGGGLGLAAMHTVTDAAHVRGMTK